MDVLYAIKDQLLDMWDDASASTKCLLVLCIVLSLALISGGC